MTFKTLALLGAASFALASCQGKEEGAAQPPVASEPVAAVAPPAGKQWTDMVVKTAEGGMLMGNPDAPVKLVEYGSMTCPHCAEFDEVGLKPLLDTYVKSGKVSFEFRNYVRDPFDITASLIARCNGPDSFFALTRSLYADQEDWIGRIQSTPAALDGLQSLPAQAQFAKIAELAGFPAYAAMRGLPKAKLSACLADEAAATELVQMNADAVSNFNIPGTPTFLLNGVVLEDSSVWAKLEPKLKAAVGA